MNKISMLYVGLDLGDKFSYITIVDQEGALIQESRLPTTRASFQRKFATLQPCRVAMEVGAHSRWASHLLRDLGHHVLVANARLSAAGRQAPCDLPQPAQGRPGRRGDPRPFGPSRSGAALSHPPPLAPGSN